MILNQLTPPIVKTLVRKVISPVKTYPDYGSALRALQNFNGYDDDALTDLIFLKTKNYINEIKQNLIQPLAAHHIFLLSVIGLFQNKKQIKVLDFGGAFGTHYFLTKSFFPTLELDWTVIELPQLVKMGKQLENSELKFIETKENFETTFGSYDLILTSGALQHVPEPEKMLSFLSKHNASYLALLRLGVNVSAKNLWVIHKAQFKDCGPGSLPDNYTNGIAAFPFCLMSEQIVKKSLSNYDLHLSCVDQSGMLVVPGHQVCGYNNLYKLK